MDGYQHLVVQGVGLALEAAVAGIVRQLVEHQLLVAEEIGVAEILLQR